MEASTAAMRAAFVRSETGQVPRGGHRHGTHVREEEGHAGSRGFEGLRKSGFQG